MKLSCYKQLIKNLVYLKKIINKQYMKIVLHYKRLLKRLAACLDDREVPSKLPVAIINVRY